jgi:hypothetical protein
VRTYWLRRRGYQVAPAFIGAMAQRGLDLIYAGRHRARWGLTALYVLWEGQAGHRVWPTALQKRRLEEACGALGMSAWSWVDWNHPEPFVSYREACERREAA